MSKRKQRSLRDIFRHGFVDETEVRDAGTVFWEQVFDEFFKVVGALLILSALFALYKATDATIVWIIYGVGVFITAQKIMVYGNYIYEKSFFDVLDQNQKMPRWKKLLGYTAAFTFPVFMILLIVTYIGNIVEKLFV